MYKIWMTVLSNIVFAIRIMRLHTAVSIVALFNIIKHHRSIIHHNSTTLHHTQSHTNTTDQCLLTCNIILQTLGKLTFCYLLKFLKFAWMYCMTHVYDNCNNWTEFNKFYSIDLNKYLSIKILKIICWNFYHFVFIFLSNQIKG